MSQTFCGANARTNVAPFDCDKARKFPAKIGIGSASYTTVQAATDASMLAALLANAILDDGTAGKQYWIHTLRDPQDQTAANTEGAVGEGVPQVLVEGKPKFQYSVEIGQNLFKRLRKFNKQRIKVMTYDDAGNLWGATDSTGKFVGAEAIFFITGNRQQTASAPVSAQITLSYISAAQYNDEAVYVPVTLGEFEPAGLLDGELRYVSNTTNVYKIAWVAPTASFGKTINLAKIYNAVIVVGMFNARTGLTYATTLAITSVAYDATLEVLTVTFDSTAYTALSAGDKIKLYTDIVSDLVLLGIEGIEGVPVILTK